MDLGALHSLLPGHVGEDGGQAAGQHGFPGTRRTDHQQVVSPGGGDLQRPLHILLPLHLGKVGGGKSGLAGLPGLGRRDRRPPGQVGGQLAHIGDGIDLQPAGQGGLRRVVRRDIQPPDPGTPGRHGHGQHPRGGAQRPGQGQLPHKGAVRVVQPQLTPGAQDAHKDGKVVDRARFFAVSRGEIHGDPADGELKIGVLYGGSDPLPGLAHRRIRQPDHSENRQSGGQITLHTHLVTGHPVQPKRTDFTYHHGISPVKNEQFYRWHYIINKHKIQFTKGKIGAKIKNISLKN